MSTFSLASLSVPLVQAPMAGGPSTPLLAAAVTEAGGLGSLAAGYLSAESLAHDISEFRGLSSGPVAVNIFAPESHRPSAADVESYRSALRTWTDAGGISGAVPPVTGDSDDMYQEKLAVVRDRRPEVVTFTFGLPDVVTIERLHEVGVLVGATVTTVPEGAAAHANGVDLLIAQGIEAGGHRAQFDQSAPSEPISTADLVSGLSAATPLPVIAAGGIDGPESAQELLSRGADAVQLGTLFLTTDEAGTKPTHRRALVEASVSERSAETTLTRAFTGRPARALSNRFTREMDAEAVVGYPQVHFLTGGIRAAAAASDDPELLNLWSGTGVGGCRQESAASLVARFAGLRRGAANASSDQAHIGGQCEGSAR
ncbi:NAD(P)H-dependent flavin oxidoreductase [Brevibacterium jeotgali]|nr:nitronate monooxygenase [Brevibacterium jeotgali]